MRNEERGNERGEESVFFATGTQRHTFHKPVITGQAAATHQRTSESKSIKSGMLINLAPGSN